MRSLRHLTPRYLADRAALMMFEKTHPDLPWLTRDMIGILDGLLGKSDVGMEFGSGRSTHWFASRVKFLTSIEDNPKWFEIVRPQVENLEVDYLFRENPNPTDPENDYAAVAKNAEPDSLDFCLVDGTSRDLCALNVLDKLKSGGILIIDNVNWFIPREQPSHAPNSRSFADGYQSDVWRQVGEQIKDWRNIWTTNGVTDTALWIKP